MLDNLWQWVGEAEAKMAETETTLIGNDLEAVEQQLAEHEVKHPPIHLYLPAYKCFR